MFQIKLKQKYKIKKKNKKKNDQRLVSNIRLSSANCLWSLRSNHSATLSVENRETKLLYLCFGMNLISTPPTHPATQPRTPTRYLSIRACNWGQVMLQSARANALKAQSTPLSFFGYDRHDIT
jgi:hypothetical protein